MSIVVMCLFLFNFGCESPQEASVRKMEAQGFKEITIKPQVYIADNGMDQVGEFYEIISLEKIPTEMISIFDGVVTLNITKLYIDESEFE